MQITFDELTSDKPEIDLLEILSLEGQFYMARLHIGGVVKTLADSEGKTCLMKSAWQIQDRLSTLNIGRAEVVHASPYDEMIGMAPAAEEPMRIGIQGPKK